MIEWSQAPLPALQEVLLLVKEPQCIPHQFSQAPDIVDHHLLSANNSMQNLFVNTQELIPLITVSVFPADNLR